MKERYFVISLLFTIFFGIFLVGFVNSAATCIDSDSGNNLSTIGNTYGTDSNQQNYSFSDFCSNNLAEGLIEYSCNLNGEVVSTTFECSNDTVCDYGACLAKENSGKCFDSDSGIIPYIKGEVYGWDFNKEIYNYTDFCSGVMLKEYYCNKDVESESLIWDCSPGVCNNGACVKAEQIVNEETKDNIPSLNMSLRYLFFGLVILIILILIIFIVLYKLKNKKTNKRIIKTKNKNK
jgi:hypothetical protein